MTITRRSLLILGSLAISVGCVAPSSAGPGTGVGSQPVAPAKSSPVIANVAIPSMAAETPEPLAPAVDLSIAPVSISKPPTDAARAFEMCLVREWVNRNGMAVVGGLGRIDHATDALHYARLTGREPELQSETAAWIVQFRGDIRMPSSNKIYIDPTCIVVNGGDGGFFGTGGSRQVGSDVVTEPQADAVQPDRALPPPKP